MFGLSLTKLIVLALAIYGAWQLFRWFERRNAQSPTAPPQNPPEEENEESKAVEMEQDPETGVWRPKDKD
jgi:hypothetical protein